jgi:hypothetical protein
VPSWTGRALPDEWAADADPATLTVHVSGRAIIAAHKWGVAGYPSSVDWWWGSILLDHPGDDFLCVLV